jgi:hypothetical protein
MKGDYTFYNIVCRVFPKPRVAQRTLGYWTEAIWNSEGVRSICATDGGIGWPFVETTPSE